MCRGNVEQTITTSPRTPTQLLHRTFSCTGGTARLELVSMSETVPFASPRATSRPPPPAGEPCTASDDIGVSVTLWLYMGSPCRTIRSHTESTPSILRCGAAQGEKSVKTI